MTEFEFYPNTMSDAEREAHLSQLYPIYVRPDRPHRVMPAPQAEPEPQHESPLVIESAPDISAPPVEPVKPDVQEPDVQQPKRIHALKNIYIAASSSLSGKIHQ